MGMEASQITSLAIVCSTVYSAAYQRKHQSSASLAFVRRIHRCPVNSPHKWPVTRKMFQFDDFIMKNHSDGYKISKHELHTAIFHLKFYVHAYGSLMPYIQFYSGVKILLKSPIWFWPRQLICFQAVGRGMCIGHLKWSSGNHAPCRWTNGRTDARARRFQYTSHQRMWSMIKLLIQSYILM